MQSLQRVLHLGGMEKILRWFLPVAILLSAMSCSKENDGRARYEFDAEWAEAYYYGTDVRSGVDCYQLDLAQGRTGEDLDLISSGAVVRLLISAPAAGGIDLPDGLYQGSAHREEAYTFNYGTLQDDKSVAGSFVGLRVNNGSGTQILPIDRGKVSVKVSGDGHYEVRAEVTAATKPVRFVYRGTIRTLDCTEPD